MRAALLTELSGLLERSTPFGVVMSPAMSNLRKLTDDARALAEPLTLLTLERNDLAGALAVATSLKAQGRLDSGRLQMLVQLQDDATELERALAGLLGDGP